MSGGDRKIGSEGKEAGSRRQEAGGVQGLAVGRQGALPRQLKDGMQNMAEDDNKSREQRLKELRARLDAVSRTFSRKKRDTAFSADEIRRAIRKQRPSEKPSAAPAPVMYRRDLPRRDAPSPESGAGQGRRVTLEEAVAGVEVHSGRGKAFVVSARLDDLHGAECIGSTLSKEILIEACTSKKLLITFNGKSFDLPFIPTRAVVNGIPFDIEPTHFDLLHECRRIWKDVLPDCRLKTLERHICNRARYGDIPGDQIPEAYHAYVRTENAWQMVGILKHNMLDLVTLADLMTHLPKL